ncbi:helix-turn-helix domain-containing protein [Actinomadura litoris]|uniref:helix-turn-helix domain-containing protein n=1 Tax=Actinomadura litoris TaxID=2678616 RepID=UPI001FA6E61A|nr:helix-turn-helix transcriptional regulator [Actinomadura litoris]
MDRSELAGFLRSRRERVGPREAGLAPGGRRQTPGLRRAEVALLAGISVDYYIRLEQGCGPRPSGQVLTALGRALRLSDDESDYLLGFAGRPPPRPSREVPGNVLRLLERLDAVPAMVINVRYDVLAWNRMLTALIGDLAEAPPERRNTLRWLFSGRLDEDKRALARRCVADLRASGRYPEDPAVREIVAELSAASPEFAALWAAREVEVQRTLTKRAVHPVAGELELDCEILPVPGTDQRVVLYTAAPGSLSRRGLELLRDG